MKHRFCMAIALIGLAVLAGCGGGGGGTKVEPTHNPSVISDKSALNVAELGSASLQTVTITTSGGLSVADLEIAYDPNVILNTYPQSDTSLICHLGLSPEAQSGTYSCSFYSAADHGIKCSISLKYQAAVTPDEYPIKLNVQRLIVALNDSPQPTVLSVNVWSTQPDVDISKLFWSWTITGIRAEFQGYDWDQSAIYYIYVDNNVPDGTYTFEVGSQNLKYRSGRIEVIVG